MDASPDELPTFFDRYGWRFERHDQTTFLTGFSGESGRFEIVVRLMAPYVSFTINPFLKKPEDHPLPSSIHSLILRTNGALNMAKFALDLDGDVSLSVVLPTDGFSYSHFADAMTALSVYADAYRGPFEDAASDDAGEVV